MKGFGRALSKAAKSMVRSARESQSMPYSADDEESVMHEETPPTMSHAGAATPEDADFDLEGDQEA